MYVMDGIAYAGEQEKPITILCVKPLEGYQLWIRFSNGHCGIFDTSPILDTPAFIALKEKTVFDRVYVDFGAPTWENGAIDIAPEYVYEHTDITDSEKGA